LQYTVLATSQGKRLVLNVDATSESHAAELAKAQVPEPCDVVAVMEPGQFEMMQSLFQQSQGARSKTGALPGLGGKLEA